MNILDLVTEGKEVELFEKLQLRYNQLKEYQLMSTGTIASLDLTQLKPRTGVFRYNNSTKLLNDHIQKLSSMLAEVNCLSKTTLPSLKELYLLDHKLKLIERHVEVIEFDLTFIKTLCLNGKT